VAIRERCQQVLELAYADRLRHFAYHPEKLPEVATYVAEVTRDAYPNLDVPFHSRWRHFDVSGLDRVAQLDEQLGACSPAERARCHFDLVMTSVLLDAGAGAHWRYHEARSGETYSRSEGLAVASFNTFSTGLFSSRGDYPWQADARGLQSVTAAALADAFQVTAANPLVGLAGRAALLRALGTVVEGAPQYCGTGGARLGHLFDYLCARQQTGLCRPARFCSRCSRVSALSGQGASAWAGSISAMSGVTVKFPAQGLPPASCLSTSCHNG